LSAVPHDAVMAGLFVASEGLAAPHGRDRLSGAPMRRFAATQSAHRRRIACDRSNGHRQPRGLPRAFDRQRSTVANRAQRFVSHSLVGLKSEGEVATQRLAIFGEPGRRLADGENERPVIDSRAVSGKLDAARSLDPSRWLAIVAREGSVAMSPRPPSGASARGGPWRAFGFAS